MNNSIRYSLLLLMLVLPSTLCAQEPQAHPIDKALDVCTEKNPTTGAMVECVEIAHKKWDTELNKNYQALLRKLKPAGKQQLITSQRSWIVFRDNEFKLIDSIYDEVPGTMYIPMRYEEKMEIVKRRALALVAHIDMLNEGEP